MSRKPYGTWSELPSCVEAVRHKCYTELSMTKEDIHNRLSYGFLVDNGMRGMLLSLSAKDIGMKELKSLAFPEIEWDLPGGWLDKETRVEAVMKLVEAHKGSILRVEHFQEAGLYSMLRRVYKGVIRDCLQDCAPNYTHMSSAPRLRLNREGILKEIGSYVEKKYAQNGKLPTRKEFREDNMYKYLRKWRGSVVSAINEIFPGRFREWEFGQVPHKFWESEENRDNAIDWLTEKYRGSLKREYYVLNGLNTLYIYVKDNDPGNYRNVLHIQQSYKKRSVGRNTDPASLKKFIWHFVRNNDRPPYPRDIPFNTKRLKEYVEEMFPGRFQPWEFASVPHGFWDKRENINSALLWLERKVGRKLTHNDFYRNRLTGAFNALGYSGIKEVNEYIELRLK